MTIVHIDHRDMVGRVLRDIVRSAGVDPDSEDPVCAIHIYPSETIVEMFMVDETGHPRINPSTREFITRSVSGPVVPYNWKVE